MFFSVVKYKTIFYDNKVYQIHVFFQIKMCFFHVGDFVVIWPLYLLANTCFTTAMSKLKMNSTFCIYNNRQFNGFQFKNVNFLLFISIRTALEYPSFSNSAVI